MRVQLPRFAPHPGQQRILQNRRHYNVCAMGRRFGKTYLMQHVLVGLKGGAFVGNDGKNGLPCAWYAPNDSYFVNVFRSIERAMYPVIDRAVGSPRPVIHFKNGGRIDFWTLETPLRCGRGNKYARVIIDEAAYARHLKEAWEQTIEYTLADHNGDAWFISTPYGMNYFHELWQRGNPDNPKRDPQWQSFQSPSFENPHLPEGWMEQKRATTTERAYNQEVLAQFLRDGVGVFRRVHDSVVATPPDRQRPVVIGVDWGRTNDFTAMVAINTDGHVVDADRFTDIGFEVQRQRLKVFAARFPQAPIVVERNSFGQSQIEELSRDPALHSRLIAFETTAASKIKIIEDMALAFEQHKISLPAIDWLIDELIAFDQERTSTGLIKYGAPPGRHDDGVMAMAIAYSHLGVAIAPNYRAVNNTRYVR